MDNEMLRRQIEALHTRYIQSIDEDKLEEWHGLFTETGLYKIVTRENFDQGLPLAVMECRSRGMMQDREERIVVPDSRRIETLLVIPL